MDEGRKKFKSSNEGIVVDAPSRFQNVNSLERIINDRKLQYTRLEKALRTVLEDEESEYNGKMTELNGKMADLGKKVAAANERRLKSLGVHPEEADAIFSKNLEQIKRMKKARRNVEKKRSVLADSLAADRTRWKLAKREMKKLKKYNETFTDDVDHVVEATPALFPEEIWRMIFSFVSDNDSVNLCAVCRQFQEIVRRTKSHFDLTRCHRLNVDVLLDFALSETCSGLNLDQCRWLDPATLLRILNSGTQLRHLSLVDCRIDEECARAACRLPLESLSFSYNRHWRSYFRSQLGSREPRSVIPCFRSLKKFSVSYDSNECYVWYLEDLGVLRDLFKYILVRCESLEHFQLLELDRHSPDVEPEDKYGTDDNKYTFPRSFFQLRVPFLPKLRSLVVNIESCDDSQTMTDFMQAVLKDRVHPLEHVDLGVFTADLFTNGLLFHPKILEKRTFVLSCGLYHVSSVEDFEDLSALLERQGPFEKLRFENVFLAGFPDLISKILERSRETIREVVLKNCALNYGERDLRGIESLAVNYCPQITVLHLGVSRWCEQLQEEPGCRRKVVPYSAFEKHVAVLENISRLKNLRELSIMGEFLTCDYLKPNLKRTFHKTIPFWIVTQSCERLEQLSIKRNRFSVIHMDSIYDIAHCKKLRVLKISGVKVRGSSDFDLSRLTSSCDRLTRLHVGNVELLPIGTVAAKPKLLVGDSVKFVKNLRSLKLPMDERNFDKKFIDSLSECPHLETLSLRLPCYNMGHLLYFAYLLPSFKNLFELKLSFDDQLLHKILKLVCSSVQNEKPTFFYNISSDKSDSDDENDSDDESDSDDENDSENENDLEDENNSEDEN